MENDAEDDGQRNSQSSRVNFKKLPINDQSMEATGHQSSIYRTQLIIEGPADFNIFSRCLEIPNKSSLHESQTPVLTS
jgi:hypothetical protein